MSLLTKRNIFIISTLLAISSIAVSESTPVNASECSYSNFMIIDGECVNLDPQMKTKAKKASNPVSGLNELTGSTINTYASLLSLVGGSFAGYKFLVRK